VAKFKITGGKPLYGSVRLGGAKNASYKLMIASLLGEGDSRLLNFSRIEDVLITKDIIESLGGKTCNAGERTMFIDPGSLTSSEIDDVFGPRSRASVMFLPVLLHKFGQAVVPFPGGDKIGSRPLERHFEGMEAMGAHIQVKNNRVYAKADGLTGTHYKFVKNTHTGTETLIMAAVKAKGKTVLENAALEPEVDDLINFFNDMGAKIRRRPGKIIEIEGVEHLSPTIYKIMPDRNEAVSYACAALISQGDIIVEDAIPHHLEAFLEKVAEAGGGYEIGNYGVRFFYKGPLRAVDIETKPHPGFMTDWQPLWTIVATQCQGESIIHETIHSSRFQHVESLTALGAKIEDHQVKVDDPEKTYNFNMDETGTGQHHAIKVTGITPLHGSNQNIHDLRSGATLVLAALTTPETTILDNVEQIDRGYEDFDLRLRSMGAQIERVID
jgi:UDP-N-acetylglucosamine 1-carboxyvinyltransferase